MNNDINLTNTHPKTKPKLERLAYTTTELSQLLNISIRSLMRLEDRGLLKPCRALRKKLYSAAAVAAFLEENK